MNKSGLTPFDNKILVRIKNANTKTAGGILLPEQEAERLKYAEQVVEIVELGSNALNLAKNAFVEHNKFMGDNNFPPTSLTLINANVGDTILIGKYAGQSIKGDDENDYRLIVAEDIWAIKGEK